MLEPGTEEERQEASSIRYVVGVRLAQLTTGAIAVYHGVELQGIIPAGAVAGLPEWLQVVLWDEAVGRDLRWRNYERRMMEAQGPGPLGPQQARVSIEDAGGL